MNFFSKQFVYQVLRISVAMCFIGHGIFGFITKAVWCNYFAVVGIGGQTAYALMPLVGTMDVLMGLTMLIYPVRFVPAWLVFWGLLTALMRPLAGEPFAEFIERSGNYGVPFAMLILLGTRSAGNFFKTWFTRINPRDIILDEVTVERLRLCLKITVFLLLAGHGWLNLIQKPGLINQYISIGIPNPALTAQAIGVFEILAAFTVLIKPIRPVLIALLIWKAASELFYPEYGIIEWVERGGSYGSIIALWAITQKYFFEKVHKPVRQEI
jgi:hypothetical protein